MIKIAFLRLTYALINTYYSKVPNNRGGGHNKRGSENFEKFNKRGGVQSIMGEGSENRPVAAAWQM